MTLNPEQPYGEAAATIIAQRSEAVFAQRAGVLDMADIERVHRMRVATRMRWTRSMSAMSRTPSRRANTGSERSAMIAAAASP